MEQNNLPVGFGMTLAQNAPALRAFAAMSEEEQQAVLEQTKQVRSKIEMRQLVERLAEQN
ncbi:MAG: hypothetical protein II458_01715 [Oscillospiraceae bacterium]|nr:hypothetical protein [Oscillospiraceae bacterium]